jgi:hypothetical protein
MYAPARPRATLVLRAKQSHAAVGVRVQPATTKLTDSSGRGSVRRSATWKVSSQDDDPAPSADADAAPRAMDIASVDRSVTTTDPTCGARSRAIFPVPAPTSATQVLGPSSGKTSRIAARSAPAWSCRQHSSESYRAQSRSDAYSCRCLSPKERVGASVVIAEICEAEAAPPDGNTVSTHARGRHRTCSASHHQRTLRSFSLLFTFFFPSRMSKQR